MRRIAFVSEKGGTGKTTSAINVAVGLAKSGLRVLFADLDPQSNATLVLLQGQAAELPTMGAVLLDQVDAHEAIRPTATPGLDILPADVSLADANLTLAGEVGRERRLRVALDEVRDRYDVVVVDTSPQRSLLTVNALVFAEEVLVPVDPGLFAVAGLGQLQATVEEVRKYLDNRALRIAGLILTRTRNDNVSRDVEAQLRGLFGELVYKTTIPTNAKLEEAHSRFQSVLDYSPRSAGAIAYTSLTEEIITNGRTTNRTRLTSGRTATTHNAA